MSIRSVRYKVRRASLARAQSTAEWALMRAVRVMGLATRPAWRRQVQKIR